MVRILTYHSVNNTANFNAQLAYLAAQKYHVVTVDEFLDLMQGRAPLREKQVLITFDDGDPSVLDHAMPILRNYGFPALMFVVTSLVGTRLPFWWDEIIRLGGDVSDVRKAKLLPNAGRLRLLEELRGGREKCESRQLTVDELRELESNQVAIANHSHTHPMFDNLSADEISAEIDASVSALTQWGFRYADVFAYPNGNSSPQAERILKDKGIRAAFLFDHKIASGFGNPLRVSRLSVDDHTPLWKFRMILSGLHSHIVPITKRLHKLLS